MISTYIFPFHEVKKGSKIILYGAGRMGKDYYWQVTATNYCEIAGWMDSSFAYDMELQYPFCSFSQLKKIKYDHLVISVLNPDIVIHDIFPQLIREGVNPEKIIYFMRSPIYDEDKNAFFADRNLNFPRERTREERFLCTHEMCVGCSACYSACPTKAISMKMNTIGFLYPHIDDEKCISCQKCSNVCPVLQNKSKKSVDTPKIYYALADDKIREQASSGGIFPLIAQHFIKQNGIVCGALFNEKMELEHTCAFSQEELLPLYKSKYCQSHIGNILKDIKTYLNEGKKVLFCGTPCQVAGLQTYLCKEYDNLFTIDLFCHGVPSQKMLLDFIKEKVKDKEIKGISFRNKSNGWKNSVYHIDVQLTDGTQEQIFENNYYIKGFLENLTLRPSCYQCKFNLFPRKGDLSIGDAWDSEWLPANRDRELGISLVSINSRKGGEIFDMIKTNLEYEKTCSALIAKNSVYTKRNISVNREIWKNLYPAKKFSESYLEVSNDFYDIAVVGGYSWSNYGDEITYYALYYLLNMQWHKKVLMVTWTKDALWPVYRFPVLFQNSPYPENAIAPEYNSLDELKGLNEKTDCFLVGSGQYVKPGILLSTNRLCLLEWVANEKKKIAYSASWGHDFINLRNREKKKQAEAYNRFDAFAVREQSAVELAQKEFGICAEWVLDPVFLCDRKMYDDIIGARKLQRKEIFGYILDPSRENEHIITTLEESFRIPASVITAGSKSADQIKNLWNLEVLEFARLESWLLHLRDAEYIVTDSFHAMCLAIIFRKQFSVIVNPNRGVTRYESLLGYLGLTSRMIAKPTIYQADLDSQLHQKINYEKVNTLLDKMKDKSIQWLKSQI